MGASIYNEWPQGCSYWSNKRVSNFLLKRKFEFTTVHGCMYDLKAECGINKGMPIKKPWRIASSPRACRMNLDVCDGSHTHAPCAGGDTVRTENYTPRLVAAMAEQMDSHVVNMSTFQAQSPFGVAAAIRFSSARFQQCRSRIAMSFDGNTLYDDPEEPNEVGGASSAMTAGASPWPPPEVGANPYSPGGRVRTRANKKDQEGKGTISAGPVPLRKEPRLPLISPTPIRKRCYYQLTMPTVRTCWPDGYMTRSGRIASLHLDVKTCARWHRLSRERERSSSWLHTRTRSQRDGKTLPNIMRQ